MLCSGRGVPSNGVTIGPLFIDMLCWGVDSVVGGRGPKGPLVGAGDEDSMLLAGIDDES